MTEGDSNVDIVMQQTRQNLRDSSSKADDETWLHEAEPKNKKAQTLVWALLCSGGTDGTRTRDPLRDRQVF